MFVVPWGGEAATPFTYIGTTDTDYDGPIDDPQITPDDVEYLLRAINGAVTTHDHRGRHPRHVGRPAPLVRAASSERTADLSRRHSVRASRQRRDHGHRRQAHDVPAHGRRHGRRSRRARSGRGRARAAPRSCRCTARDGLGRAPSSPAEHLGEPLRRRRRRRARARSTTTRRSAEPIVPGLAVLAGRGRVRGARAEMARTVDDVLSPPHPGPPARPRRVRGRGRRRSPR